MNQAVLSIDIGSSSVRASLYDTEANPVPNAESRVEYSFTASSEGGATISPDVLLDSVVEAIDGVLETTAGSSTEIVCVCASAFWHSLLGLDASGAPTTEVITWADRRASRATDALKQTFDTERVRLRTGCPPHSSYWPAKLMWLRNERESVFDNTSRWISPPDFVYERLLGRSHVGTSMASGTGLLNQNTKTWSSEMLSGLGLDETQLSRISDEPLTGLSESYSKRWPAIGDIPWFPAVGDGACSNVGSGCVGRDRLALTIGTSGAMRILWKDENAEPPDGLWLYRADASRFVCGGALSNGGNLVSWLRETLRLPDDVEKILSEMQPDSHGLTFLPLLSGERGPGWSERANGVVSGISMSTEPVQILRAAMEAVALRFALISTRLEESFPGEKEAVASGGALIASPVWAEIVSDALGIPLQIPSVEEASSRGAALLALESLGHLSVEDAAPVRPERVIEPDLEKHEIYASALDRQRRLYEKVISE